MNNTDARYEAARTRAIAAGQYNTEDSFDDKVSWTCSREGVCSEDLSNRIFVAEMLANDAEK